MNAVGLGDWAAAVREGQQPPTSERRPEPLPSHVGLWLDRMLGSQPRKEEKGWPARLELYRFAVEALAPGTGADEPPALQSYRGVFRRWREEVERQEPGFMRRVVEVEATSRLLLHPASGSTVTEGGVLIHHTYGVPYLPGSALKGAARRRLHHLESGGGEAAEAVVRERWADQLLGSMRVSAGEEPDALASLLDFADALWVPERPAQVLPGWSPLALDVVNPHHPDYYTRTDGERRAPTDFDRPVPVHRLTVAPGARFLVVVEISESQIVEPWLGWVVDEVLLPALAEDGIGALTAAGYGRLRPFGKASPSGGRPRAGAAPDGESDWLAASLFRIAGSGELAAILTDGRRASARGPAAKALLAGLPAAVRERLIAKKKRDVRATVRVRPEGLAWALVAVRPVEDDGR